MDDLSGLPDGQWEALEDCLNQELTQLMQSLAGPYLMMIQRIESQLAENEDQMQASQVLNGPVYRLRCFRALQKELYELEADQRQLLQPVLEAIGSWDMLQITPEQAAAIEPIPLG